MITLSNTDIITASSLPVYVGSDLSLKKVAELMRLSNAELATIIQCNVRTVERDRPSAKIRESINPIIYILKMLWELTNEDTQAIQRWLHTPLIEWRGISPRDCLMKDNLDAVVNLVERIYYGDSAGY